jgi:hypothetical protein
MHYIERQEVGTLVTDGPTSARDGPASYELQVPLVRWVAHAKGPFPGLRGG